MNLKELLKNFKESKWYSRKFLVVLVGMILIIIFPQSATGIVSVVGLFCGANVAQKFSNTEKEVRQAVKAIGDLALATNEKPI